MFRLILFALAAFLIFAGLRILLAKKNLSVRQFLIIYLATLAGIALLFLGFTGRLHPVFALLGVVLPFLARIFGLIMQGAQFAALFKTLRGSRPGPTSTGPDVSEIETEYIHMMLFHDTGVIDGQVRKGQFRDAKLSQLQLDQLLQLLDEVQQDADSFNLLTAYLDREHEGWQAGREQQAPPPGKDDMTEAQALAILGLDEDATSEAIIQAHKRLMQKVHPDRGGSTYLATRINAARDLLLKLRG